MDLKLLPFLSPLRAYQDQAQSLHDAYLAGDPDAIHHIQQRHPRFMDPNIPWLPLNIPASEVRSAALEVADAQLTVARWYDFKDWPALAGYAEAVADENSTVRHFESAVEAVINGDAPALQKLLSEHPELVHARSTRITHFDPPMHRATLLHYLGANGVEGYRQKTPPNAVEIATILLQAGAEVDALASLYGGECTTMALLVSSTPPAQAGLQIALAETLLDFGAAIEGHDSGQWGSPLMTALAFGFLDVAEALAARGARIDNIIAAAGLGRVEAARQLLPSSDPLSRHRAMALAAQHGHAGIVEILLDAGEDPNRYNPKGNHAHSTPLHQAALAGHDGVVRLLVERGALLDIKDAIYKATPLGWAHHSGQTAVAEYLGAQGAKYE